MSIEKAMYIGPVVEGDLYIDEVTMANPLNILCMSRSVRGRLIGYGDPF
jgi:hypothetical protein